MQYNATPRPALSVLTTIHCYAMQCNATPSPAFVVDLYFVTSQSLP